MPEPRPASSVATRSNGTWAGILLCAAGAAVAVVLNRMVPTLSALLVAILLGALMANTIGVPTRLAPGVAFSAKHLLRAGIVLLGLQVALGDIAGLGLGMVLVVIAVVTLGIAGGIVFGRLLGLGRNLTILVASGFSICGAAAVAGVNGILDADDEDAATAIALVVLYGTCMIPLVPLIVSALGLGEVTGGLWAGASIHEVAQVVAAGGIIGPAALKVAVIVKLARVLMLAPLTIALGIWLRRSGTLSPDAKRPPLVPGFVLGFLLMVVVASLHMFPKQVLADAKLVQTALLAMAMFALGLGVRVRNLVTMGPKPFVHGLATTVWVASIAGVGVALTR